MEKSVCFIGHRKIENNNILQKRMTETAVNLIKSGKTNFIFGDRSEFNSLCYEIITELKLKYPEINRIHFRKNYPDADGYTLHFLTKGYEKSICPDGVKNAGRASYVKRNEAMINESEICVFYYKENYVPVIKQSATNGKNVFPKTSGTALAYTYALKMKKEIINAAL